MEWGAGLDSFVRGSCADMSYACACTDPFTMSWRRSPSSFRTIVPSMIGPWHVRACAFVFVRA